jgi:hypothetical protein
MGYSIYIGNAVVEVDEDELYAKYTVERITHEKAPRWPNCINANGDVDISKDTNGRHPCYISMDNWARAVGLYELFLGNGSNDGAAGLLNPHSGCRRLTPDILVQISTARIKWEKSHIGAKPGWSNEDDAALAKLVWYEWWVKWALENCRIPAISNH